MPKDSGLQRIAWQAIASAGRAPQKIGDRRWLVWCVECRSHFLGGTRFAQFCSQGCRDRRRGAVGRKIASGRAVGLRLCEQCLVQMEVVNPRQKFCSDACRYRAWWLQHHGAVVTSRACRYCGEPIVAETSRRRFCNTSCRRAAWRSGRRGGES